MKFRVSSAISIVIFIYLVIRTHGIAAYVPGVWVIPLVIMSAYVLYELSKLSINSLLFIFIQSKWIILSIFILLVSIIFQHGNFRLYVLFNNLLISSVFFIIAYIWGVKDYKSEFRRVICLYYYFLFFFLFTKLVQVDFGASYTKETLGRLFYTGNTDIVLNDLILYYPFFSFVTIIGFYYLTKDATSIKKSIVSILAASNLIVFIISGFAAPLFLVVVTLLIYYVLSTGRKGFYRLLLSMPIVIISVFLFIYVIGSGKFINSGALTAKAGSLLRLFESGLIFDDFILDQITSDRWTAAKYSVIQFLEKPFFGHGIYLESTAGMLGNINAYNTAAGGHSFVIDTFAYQGLPGIVLIMILVTFIKFPLKLNKYLKKESKEFKLIASLMASFLLLNILNNVFLFSSFDNMVFLISGYMVGQLYRIKYLQ